MNEILGNRIKELRNARNLTQEQVAEQIGVSRQKYARIESGTNSISLDILSRIASALEVSVGDEMPEPAYRAGVERTSTEQIFDMLDLFYANKHMCEKLQHTDVV